MTQLSTLLWKLMIPVSTTRAMPIHRSCSLYFEGNDEADSIAFWEDCVIPASKAFVTCEDFCSSVKQCHHSKCFSGPTCASTYCDALSCAAMAMARRSRARFIQCRTMASRRSRATKMRRRLTSSQSRATAKRRRLRRSGAMAMLLMA